MFFGSKMQAGSDYSEKAEVCRSDSVKPELSEKTKGVLRRLGNFYGGGDISSPIHRSEQMREEPQSSVSVAKGCYGERRKRRFQALADMVNSWEED